MGAGAAAPLWALDLLVEAVPGRGCLVHVPDLPGLSFRAIDADTARAAAPAHVVAYGRWLAAHGATGLTPLAARYIGAWTTLRPVVGEHLVGAPVWESGHPAALFERDRRALDDEAVDAHLRVTRLALEEMRERVAPLPEGALARRPGPGRRSLAETLTHVGNCVWWYAARLDDAWPEPADPAGEGPADRPLRLLEVAGRFLRSWDAAARTAVHVPSRYPTGDPGEAWTHAKACRRLAEHALEHLPGVRRDVERARGASPGAREDP